MTLHGPWRVLRASRRQPEADREADMTLDSLSCSTPFAPQLDFDTNKLRSLIADYVGIEPEKITDEAHFTYDLGLDWLDRLELMILIEHVFTGIEISENDANQIEAVGDLIRHIENTNYAQSVTNFQNAAPVSRSAA
jgi:acyl carrier protein